MLPHLDSAYNLSRWLVRDSSLADDVVQNAIVRALTYYTSFRGDNPRAWLMRIVRNEAYTALAARRQGTVVIDTQTSLDSDHVQAFSDPAPDPEGALVSCQDKAQLARALEALPTELRECLVLREIEELAYKEIAEVTGVPVGTVMSRLWRARQALMAGFEKANADGA